MKSPLSGVFSLFIKGLGIFTTTTISCEKNFEKTQELVFYLLTSTRKCGIIQSIRPQMEAELRERLKAEIMANMAAEAAQKPADQTETPAEENAEG